MRLYCKRSSGLGAIMTTALLATVVVALANLSGHHIVSAFPVVLPSTSTPASVAATFTSFSWVHPQHQQLLRLSQNRCSRSMALNAQHPQASIKEQVDGHDDILQLSTGIDCYDAPLATSTTAAPLKVGLVGGGLTLLLVGTIAVVVAVAVLPEAAMAATSTSSSPLLNALVAYGHYACLLLITALLTFERMTIKANMSVDTEKSLVIADALYGLTAVALFYTGYLRATDFGKGWDFYAHEPFFWLKLANAGVLGGLSLFPTIIFIQRGRNLFNSADDTDSTSASLEPMSEALATRLRKVLNAELSAMATLPLFATLMARGVGYADWLPWQAGAAFTSTALIGSSVHYAKQALTWKEPNASTSSTDTASLPANEK